MPYSDSCATITRRMTTQPSIDPVQLSRIEGVHRGMLYQHLYAVACLLTMDRWAGLRLVVEHDEDIQGEHAGGQFYCQVKTREADALSPSDIDGVLDRFELLREEHASGSRPGTPKFFVVANKPAGPSLATALSNVPADVSYAWPGSGQGLYGLPEPWTDIASALDDCVGLAELLPLRGLSAPTLVWKVAAFVAFVASGRGGGGSHTIERHELAPLFEQFVEQLHGVPPAPNPLRTCGTPFPKDFTGVRLYEALPGGGKTTWAAELLRHAARPAVYFDASLAPAQGAESALAREIIGSLSVSDDRGRRAMAAVGTSGGEVLAAIDSQFAEDDSVRPLLLIDNVQDTDIRALGAAVRRTRAFDWVLLGHPGERLAQLSAQLGVTPEVLRGWDEHTVALEAEAEGLAYTPESVTQLRQLTEGNPLFVRSCVRLSRSEFNGDLDTFLGAVATGNHLTRTDQERLLAKVVGQMSEGAHRVVSLLGLSRLAIPLAALESALADGLAVKGSSVRAAVRELREWSVIEVLPGPNLRVRDVFNPLIAELRSSAMSENELVTVASALADEVFALVEGDGRTNSKYLMAHLHLLPHAGRLTRLAEIATQEDEFFVEIGLMPEIRELLRGVLDNPVGVSEADLFHVHDTLAFWASSRREVDDLGRHVEALERLAADENAPQHTQARLSLRKMELAGLKGDWGAVETAYTNAQSFLTNELWRLITSHNYANLAWRCGRPQVAHRISEAVARAYFRRLRIDPTELVLVSLPQLISHLGPRADASDELKRLADALDLGETARMSYIAGPPSLAWVHAHKLYALSGAHASAVRVGIEMVEAYVGFGDGQGAKELLEKALIPTAESWGLVDYIVQLRAQYSVVLAYCGEVEKARAVNGELLTLTAGRDDARRREVESRHAVVERIAKGELSLPPIAPIDSKVRDSMVRAASPSRQPSRGRPCPCGSGEKYKRCCAPYAAPNPKAPCPCGSGKRYKRCCGRKGRL